MAAAARTVLNRATCSSRRVFSLNCHQRRSLNTGRGFLPRPRPLPILLLTGGGYLGYQQYRRGGQHELGAPPTLATPTQVKGDNDVTQTCHSDPGHAPSPHCLSCS